MSKVILITGTSSGFGKLIAEKLHSKGHIVIGASRSIIKDVNFKNISIDINNYNEDRNRINEIINEYGKIDVLINNAGINLTGPLEIMKIEDVKKVFEKFNPEGGAYGLGRTHSHKH